MYETIKNYIEYGLRTLQSTSVNDWLGLGYIWPIVGILIVGLIFYKLDPRNLERAMARRKERQEVADIVSAALQDAANEGKISANVWHKYNKKLAHALSLPDMEPRKRIDLNAAKLACKRRLDAMGVNIANGLATIRRGRPSKKERAKAALKKA